MILLKVGRGRWGSQNPHNRMDLEVPHRIEMATDRSAGFPVMSWSIVGGNVHPDETKIS